MNGRTNGSGFFLRSSAILAWVGLVAWLAALALHKIRAFDYWWHLRTGQLIRETGSVPRFDPYSYTAEGARWIDIHWLFQVGLHAVYDAFGHVGVGVAKLAVVALIVGVLATVRGARRRTPWVVGVLAAMLAVVADRLMPRPELLSFLFLAGVVILFDREEGREGPPDRWFWCVVPIQLAWSNVHGLFATGLAVGAIYLAGELLRPALHPDAPWRRDRIARMAVAVVLGALGALANPNFVDGALYPFLQLGMIGPPEDRGLFGSLIAELLPPLSPEGAPQPLLAGLAAGLGGVAALGMALNWRRVPAAHVLLWVAFAYLALSALRNLALFGIVAAPLAIRNLDAVLGTPRAGLRLLANVSAFVATTLLAFDAASGQFFLRIHSYREPGLGLQRSMYPLAAVDWIERERPPGPLFHHMADGGLLIWRLYPEKRVLLDGRLEVYGAERFEELTVRTEEQFRALDARFAFGAILVHYTLDAPEGLLWWLYLNSRWRLVHADDTAVLFVRVEEGTPPWPEVDLDAPDLFSPLPDERGPTDRFRRYGRANLLMSLRRYPRALEEWEALLARYPDAEQGPMVRASLLQRTGRTEEAEALLRTIQAGAGEDVRLLTQLADLRVEGGDPRAARDLYDRALALEPRNSYAALRRARLAEAEGDMELAVRLYTRVVATSPGRTAHAVQAAARIRALGR